MNILICPDKFKGSLTARQVCDAVGRGILTTMPDAHVISVPLADGGEGTCELLTEWHHGTIVEAQVHGPLFSPVTAHYGISADGSTAFIEMAGASGLMLIESAQRNPLLTTSLGTGELIADALSRKVKQIVLGLGGSATNDAGIGMASALGYSFRDADSEILKPIGENLIHIHHIRADAINPLLREVDVTALCDVNNPLFGPDGAAHVYAPQKGANKTAVELLDAGLRNFRRVVAKNMKVSVDFPGAGAAGGLGAGCKIFLNAAIEKGIHYMIRNAQLTAKIKASDLVITGEGKIDRQTLSGKVVSEVISLARQAGKPVVAVCGTCELSEQEIKALGASRVISLLDEDTTPEFAMTNASALLTGKISDALRSLPGF